ncbi:hypothetical protein HZS38_02450 [Xenorhabdus nematophila]|uniref:Uncharacterized protein n=1 Tax=Xenorhabdus nematophila (strain ATCC 19061 / DSM 3370 / CCUG 14189 / LMG 1036 / NCIMB 9965 / AN6) TaxID=406817 RepID=D3V9R7_XENNA|nr:hypothetical protein [Xenorhabdus nematophila]CEE95158.1 hypothetical protein XNA1_4990006 [Xenorhabdus nematophila str. Anatoliense]CEF29281.1 hypothetical protein XNW1_1660028 [Xenorhabdus nematophila str. Websteri]AYA39541.1 hypothetical protein D3790_02800 [Xenorhabdus nematophila]KHD28939.1 hypothetical protein LH67_07045 [Xenorhabdus nematophila]MBA0018104.1 hypothetical protein [Xenorhabdus nematophila]
MSQFEKLPFGDKTPLVLIYGGIFLLVLSILKWMTSDIEVDWLYNSVESLLAIGLVIVGIRLHKKYRSNNE